MRCKSLWRIFFIFAINISLMKIKMLKDVYSSAGWRKEGEILSVDDKTARHYIAKGIGVEYKEEKAPKQTKENKAVKKRTTKKAK